MIPLDIVFSIMIAFCAVMVTRSVRAELKLRAIFKRLGEYQ